MSDVSMCECVRLSDYYVVAFEDHERCVVLYKPNGIVVLPLVRLDKYGCSLYRDANDEPLNISRCSSKITRSCDYFQWTDETKYYYHIKMGGYNISSKKKLPLIFWVCYDCGTTTHFFTRDGVLDVEIESGDLFYDYVEGLQNKTKDLEEHVTALEAFKEHVEAYPFGDIKL